MNKRKPVIVKRSRVNENVIVTEESIFETKTIMRELTRELMKPNNIKPEKEKRV